MLINKPPDQSTTESANTFLAQRINGVFVTRTTILLHNKINYRILNKCIQKLDQSNIIIL